VTDPDVTVAAVTAARPRILRVDPASGAAVLARDLMDAAALLASGGVVAFPTETIYGLAADPASAEGVAAIFAAKGRAAGEALPLIAADIQAARRVAAVWPPLAARLAAAFWPGPLTLVVPVDGTRVVAGVTAGRSTVGLRVSSHPVAQALAAAAPGGLITATSANRSGTPSLATADAVAAAIGRAIALVVDGGPSPGGPGSTLVDLTKDAPRLIREGPIAWSRVLESLREPARFGLFLHST
jgi:L-threonylcarbamoyladenylate synthase